MSTLYIDKRGLELRSEGARLQLYREGHRLGSVPMKQLDRIIVQERTRIDTGLLGKLAEMDIGLYCLDDRRPARTAIMLGRPGKDVLRRRAQYRRQGDSGWTSYWSRLLIRHKLSGQHGLLQRMLEARPDQRHGLVKGMKTIERLVETLDSGEKPRDPDGLLGLEGAAAAAYFQAMTTVFPPSLDFSGRNRRPPRDPVNACLSLGYTLLHAEAVQACLVCGLDPMIGYLHAPAFGRESLASDLIEPLRPKIDEWVWQMFRQRALTANHFHRQGKACLLDKNGRTLFYPAWEKQVGAMRKRLRAMARRLARHLDEEK